jgi:hypothetical protein
VIDVSGGSQNNLFHGQIPLNDSFSISLSEASFPTATQVNRNIHKPCQADYRKGRRGINGG